MSIPNVLKDVFHLVYPRECPGCERLLSDQEHAICWTCLMDIEKTNFESVPKANDLYLRFAGKVPLEGAGALFYFDKLGRMRKIISALKYQNLPQVGKFLGEVYGRKLVDTNFLEGIDKIVPVPLHRKRLRSRGYNQATAFAEGLSKETGIPVDEKLLIRNRKTATQTRKSRSERWKNVKDVFAVRDTSPAGILLVDDVITTGATIEACIRSIQSAQEAPSIMKIAAIGVTRHD